MWRIAICDDDPYQIEMITDRVREEFGKNFESSAFMIKTYTNGLQLVDEFASREFNVVFLDIRLGDNLDYTGLDIAAKLREKDKDFFLAFVTGFSDYVFDADRYNPIKFVRKENKADYKDAFDRIMRLDHTEYFTFPGSSKRTTIAVKDVLYFKADRHKLTVFDKHGQSASGSLRLSDLADAGLDKNFVVCHKSYAVNIQHVLDIDSTQIILIGGICVPVGRAFVQMVRQLRANHIGKRHE